jgi:nitrous oxidase accessory protein
MFAVVVSKFPVCACLARGPRQAGLFVLAMLVLSGTGMDATTAPDLPALQPLIDATPEGGVLRPAAGRYAGPVEITRPLTLDGAGQVVIASGGRGTVLSVRASGVTVRGLRLTGSGESHDQLDAGILVEGDDNRIEDNTIDDALFGVHLKAANRNLVRANRIRSKRAELSLRGDGIRVWNGRDNRIEANDLAGVRDITVANAPDNHFVGNTVRESRYAMHFIFSPRCRIEGNTVDGNATGIVVLYSDEVVARGNRIRHSRGVAGAGLTFKESSHARVEDNEVVHCAVGATANAPSHPENIIHFRGNRFAHNVAAMHFYGENGGHVIHGNRFEKNLVQVTVSASMSARGNDWRGNYWDDYQGFDRDRDGVGDLPYEIHAFADRIWMEIPKASFFRNSPALELLDFLERLAPFTNPELILRDPAPVAHGPAH